MVIKDRHNYIINKCKGKKVLHLGSVGNAVLKPDEEPGWLHGKICEVAKSCEGIDNNLELIKEANKLCDSKIYHDSVLEYETHSLYDVIVAGEIIEHITNFDKFFDRIKLHLKEDGDLIITTPNAFKLTNILPALFFGRVPGAGSDHVVYFDKSTLNVMVNRFGFEITSVFYNTEKVRSSIGNRIMRLLGKSFYSLWNDNILISCRKVK